MRFSLRSHAPLLVALAAMPALARHAGAQVRPDSARRAANVHDAGHTPPAGDTVPLYGDLGTYSRGWSSRCGARGGQRTRTPPRARRNARGRART